MDEHLLFRDVTDPYFGTLGYIAIDTAYRGSSVGGLRVLPDVTPQEISHMARTQTRKYLFSGIPLGGAKAGIVLSRKVRQRRDDALRAFGRAISREILGGFWPGCDMGSGPGDVRAVLLGSGVPSLAGYPSTETYTAMGIISSIDAALEHRGMDWGGLRLAIEGYGRVGSALAGMAAKRGARIVSISNTIGCISHERGLDISLIDSLKARHGNLFIAAYPHQKMAERGRVFRSRCDVLVPCARCWSIGEHNADSILAPIIACGANVPMTAAIEKFLWKKGKAVVPDAVSNCGGVVGGNLARFMPDDEIRKILDTRLGKRVLDVLESGEAPSEYLRAFCRRRREELRDELKPVARGAVGFLSDSLRFHVSDRLFGKERLLRGLFPL